MRVIGLIKESLGFDYRSLALYRFLMGIIVSVDVLYRLPDLTNFYTDVGVVPRSIFINELAQAWSFSLHLANGTTTFAFIMFMIQLLCGIMLIVGYKTRWAMIGAFVLNVSVHNRNWLVNNGGDDIMRALLFLSIFLPLNKYFSIDSALSQNSRPEKKSYFSTWTLAFFLQVFVIYFVSYILKDHPIWRKDYTAIFYASRLDIFSTPIGLWLRNFPFIQKSTTIYTIILEWLGPLLLIFNFFAGRWWWIVRLTVVILFLMLHSGIILTMWIRVFPYLCLVMWLLFIPGPVWDKISAWRRRGKEAFSIYFDKECFFCKKMALLIREFLVLPSSTIDEAQNHPDIHKDMVKHHSWVVINGNGERFFHFNAFVQLMKNSLAFSGLTFLLPKKLGHAVYVWVSHNRPLMGKMSQFLDFPTVKKEIVLLKWVKELLGAFIFATLFMWNLTTIKKWHVRAPFFQDVARYLHLYQEWNMFSPYPKLDNVWIEIPAVLGDGSQIELLTGDRDIYSIKSDRFPGIVKNEHWRKFFLNLSERSEYSKYYGGYLCREWNDRIIQLVKGTTLRKFEINVYSQLNLINGERAGVNKKMSWTHWCFDEDYKREREK